MNRRKFYNKRIWLNDQQSPSTGSIVAYSGTVNWRLRDDEDGKLQQFFEVADCHCKVRLHRASGESLADFIKKMRLLASSLEDYIEHLENNGN